MLIPQGQPISSEAPINQKFDILFQNAASNTAFSLYKYTKIQHIINNSALQWWDNY